MITLKPRKSSGTMSKNTTSTQNTIKKVNKLETCSAKPKSSKHYLRHSSNCTSPNVRKAMTATTKHSRKNTLSKMEKTLPVEDYSERGLGLI